jgi:D-alanyl-D-alanine carboxypeptidase
MNRAARRGNLVIAAVVVVAVVVLVSPSLGTIADQSAAPGLGGSVGVVAGSHRPAGSGIVATTSVAPTSTAPERPSPTSDGGQATSAPTVEPTPTPDPPTTPIPATATPELKAALDARLERLRAKRGIPGISAAIVFADGSSWQGTAGLADVATGVPVEADTAFSVASVSKTFTAALILALIEDGRLTLDSTARTYLPTLKINRSITVRHLLDHRSGLRDFYYNANIDHALLVKPAKVWSAARSLRYLGPAYSKPGRSWHYSNTNYLILGMLAEVVGGAPVADQLRERFFEPLGLDHTYYQSVEVPRGPVAKGYRFLGTDPTLPAIDLSDGSSVVPFTSVVTASGAAGSIATTGTDLARWARALYGDGALSQASRDEMVADLYRTARYLPGVAYGLGVQAVDVAGRPTLGHSGRFLGARAAVRWLQRQHIGISVLTNQSRSDPNVVLRELLKVALPRPDSAIPLDR